MAKDSDPLAGVFETKESGGALSGLLAEEDEFDRRMMWRLGSWGAAAVGAVIVAVMSNQAQLGWRRDQVAAFDIARQSDRLQILTKESQNEARRLASAIETLNNDRDRLYSRVTVLEQGLDSVTGAVAKQRPVLAVPQPSNPEPPAPAAAQLAAPAQAQAPLPQAPLSQAPILPQAAVPGVAPVVSMAPASNDKSRTEPTKDQAGQPLQTIAAASLLTATASTTPAALPAIPLFSSKLIMAADPTNLPQPENQPKPIVETAPIPPTTDVAAAAPAAESEAVESEGPAITVEQTRFAVDLGGGSSVERLRVLWRGLLKSNPDLASLRPIIMIREGKTGPGMQLRLGAGPLMNAAAAAKLCAALTENKRSCETTVFDGQRLSMRGPQASPGAEKPPPATTRTEKQQHTGSLSKQSKHEEPPPRPPPGKPEASAALSSFLKR